MAPPPDILGREPAGRGRWSATAARLRWLRPVGIGAAVVAVAGWFALAGGMPRGSLPAQAQGPAIAFSGGSPGRECGHVDRGGLAWGHPQSAPAGDGRLVQWRVHLCNRARGAITIWAVKPVSGAERLLGAGQVAALHSSGVIVDPGPSLRLPGRIAAGADGDVGLTSAIVDCDQQRSRAGVVASVSIAGGSRRPVELPVVLPGPSPAAQWCGGAVPGDLPIGRVDSGLEVPRLSLLQGAAPTAAVAGHEVDVHLTLLNPNDVAIRLTGLHSPSAGVSVVDGAAGTGLDPGGTVAITVRLRATSCVAAFLDAGWQLTFTATVGSKPILLTPVRLGVGSWQLPAMREICPHASPLATAAGPAAMEVFSAGSGGGAGLLMVQVVRNVGRQQLVLRSHPVSPPGLTLQSAEIVAGDQSQIGRRGGAALTVWQMSPSSLATLTFSYRLDADADVLCESPPADSWPAPVSVTTTGRRPVVVTSNQPVAAASSWRGGWLLAGGPSCGRALHRGHGPPVLLEAGQQTLAGGRVSYPVTAYGIPGEPPATLAGIRLVGAYAGFDLRAATVAGPVAPGSSRTFVVSLPVRCAADTVPATIAVPYLTPAHLELSLALLDLPPPIPSAGRGCPP